MVHYLTIIAFILSPIYLWRSGLPQVSHIVMALAMILMLILSKWKKTKPGIIGFIFAVWAFIVNGVFYMMYYDSHFLFSGLYYLFNVCVWNHCVSVCFRRHNLLLVIWRILWVELLLEGMVVFLGLGRVLDERSLGTFNDPNQLSHWVVWAVVLITSLGWYLHHKWLYGFIALIYANAILLFSASRSGTLGLLTLWVMYFIVAAKAIFKRTLLRQFPRAGIGRLYPVLFTFASVCLIVLILIPWGNSVFEVSYSEISREFVFFLQRWQREIQNLDLFWEERGYVRLWRFPQYLVLGSGEGAHYRWGGIPVEIHSTLAGALFYYGLVGFVLLLIFLYEIWRRQPSRWFKLVFFAPLVYSLGTYNLRNTFFWIGYSILYVVGTLLEQKQDNTNGSEPKMLISV